MRSFQKLIRWFGYIETHATADVPIMLLGTKCDLEHRREIPTEDGKKVSIRERERERERERDISFSCQYADAHGIEFFHEVSAKTGLNVRNAFDSFIREVHKKVCWEGGREGRERGREGRRGGGRERGRERGRGGGRQRGREGGMERGREGGREGREGGREGMESTH